MNLEQRKPIHLKCPKCGHDFSTNTNKIVEERQFQQQRIAELKKKLSYLKENHVYKNAPVYKRTKEAYNDCMMALQGLNRLNRNLSENAEIEKNKVFYKLVKNELGEEKTIKLMMEAEDSIVYRDYDMAIQRFNNFSGV